MPTEARITNASRVLRVPYIAWEIQTTCNMGCPFCYSSSWNQFKREESRTRVSVEKIHAGLGALREAGLGIEIINWSGGEPLLRYKDLFDILRRSRTLGFKNIISTNCMYSEIAGLGDRRNRARSNERFERFIRDRIGPWLDWMAISLDSADPAINNNIMRLRPDGRGGSPTHFEDVRSFLDLHRATPFTPRLKVNTVVTRRNIDSGVEEIGELLRDIPCVWKLVQFNPRECPPSNRREFEIPTDEFLRRLEACKARYQGMRGWQGLEITSRVYDGMDEPYCFLVINAAGEILLPYGEKHIPLASISDPHERIKEKLVTQIRHHLRDTDTYRKCGASCALDPIQVFSDLNRRIMEGSYSPFVATLADHRNSQ